MIDPTGRLSDVRFPSTGTIAQVALLLAGEIADRVLDVDAPELPKLPIPHVSDDHLIEQLDAAIPEAGIFEDLADEDDDFVLPAGEPAEPPPPVTYPKIDDDWLADKVTELVDQFGRTFAAQWQADHNGLRKQALGLLQRLPPDACGRRRRTGVARPCPVPRRRGLRARTRSSDRLRGGQLRTGSGRRIRPRTFPPTANYQR